MSEILPFIVIGLVSGSIYGLAGVGLVLTYKTSNLFNFAQGAIAAVSAYVFYTLYVLHGVAWPWAAAIAIFVVGPPLSLLLERIATLLAGKGLALKVAATVGLLLVVDSGVTLIFGTDQARTVPVFLSQGEFTVAGTVIQTASLITVVFAVISTGVLYALFRFTRLGAAMRAAVDSADLLELSGTSSIKVRRAAWLIGVLFACCSGVLLSPALAQLDPDTLTLLVVTAFGAAAIGAFRSLPLTFIGGLLIGVAASLSTKYFTSGILLGVPPALPFIVLFVALLVLPRKYLAERSRAVPTSRPTWTTPIPVQLGGAVLVLAALAFVPSFAGVHLDDWTVALSYIIVFLSLGLLVRTAGQVSLCHVTFLAIGAATFSHLTVGSGIPWLLALVLTGLIAVPIGALLAIPAIRLTPLYLALATFGFAIFVQYMFYQQSWMFGAVGAGLNTPRPSWLGLGSDTRFYFLVLGFAVLASIAMLAIERGRLGQLLRGMADAPTAVATGGASTQVTWVLVFAISTAFAAVAGALGAAAQQTVSLDGYPPLSSLTLLALVMIVVGGTPWYAVIAGLALIVPPSYLSGTTTSYWLQLLFGVSAVIYAISPSAMHGAPPALQHALDRWFRRTPADAHKTPVTSAAAVATRSDSVRRIGAREQVQPASLEVEGLTVKFGGLVAVEGLNLKVPTNRITGLIGPNGAGKTTTFNACSGLASPSQGTLVLGGRNIRSLGPARRAQLGIGRTFQQMQLFDSLSVRENVMLGAETELAGANPVRHVLRRRGDGKRIAAATNEALDLCGIGELAALPATSLSTGQRRLVELARTLAGSHRILLLDEPSSGLDRTETAQFGRILQQVVDDRGVGILLVEHDMSLVMTVCEYIYVLDFGRLIFEGQPDEVLKSPIVQAAYLGRDEVEKPAVAVEDGSPTTVNELAQ